jgi:hypothetical protein
MKCSREKEKSEHCVDLNFGRALDASARCERAVLILRGDSVHVATILIQATTCFFTVHFCLCEFETMIGTSGPKVSKEIPRYSTQQKPSSWDAIDLGAIVTDWRVGGNARTHRTQNSRAQIQRVFKDAE